MNHPSECTNCGFVPYSTAYTSDKCPICLEPTPKIKKRIMTNELRLVFASLAFLCLVSLVEYHDEGWKAAGLILGAFLLIGGACYTSRENL